MGDYRVLREISLYLRSLLFEHLRANGALMHRFKSESSVALDSPADLADGGAGAAPPLLSLYLYQVTPVTHVRNTGYPAAGRPAAAPLNLDLYYLITPFSPSPEDNLVMLGHVMQILAAHPAIRAGSLDSHPRELKIAAQPMSLEELTRIWHAFHQPHRLSVSCQVQAVTIEGLPQA